MVLVELLETVLGFVGGLVGLSAAQIGALAVMIAVLYYLYEFSDVLFRASRWTRVGVFVGAALTVAAIAGVASGVITLNSGLGGVVSAVVEWLNGVMQ